MTATPSPRQNVHLLWFGTAVAAAADQLLFVGIPIFALSKLGLGAQWLGYALAMQYLPSLLFAQLLAGYIDRNDRRTAMLIGSVLCCLGALLLAMSSAFDLGSLVVIAVLGLSFVLGIGNALYTIASGALSPVIAADRPVTDVLTGQASVRTAWRLIGLAAAGPFLDLFGGAALLAFVAAAFALRGISSVWIGLVPNESPAAGALGSKAPVDKRGAWSLVWNTPVLRDGVLGLFLLNVGGALVSGAYFAYAYELLKLSSTTIGVVMFLGTVAALGALRWAKAAVKKRDAAIICGLAGVIAALSTWPLPLLPVSWGLVALGIYHIVFGAVSAVVVVAYTIMRQKSVANEVLGRVVSVSASSNAAAVVLGAAMSSLLLPVLEVRQTLLVGSALATLAVIPLWNLARRARG